MSELAIEDLVVRYGHGAHAHVAVDGVSLTVPPGEIVGLVGESGSGKSTIARAVVGLAPVTSGRILIDGVELSRGRRSGKPRRSDTGRSPRSRPVQMVFQDPQSSLDPRMSIGSSIAEALPPDVPRARRRAEIERLLELVHLDPQRADARPGELSGGQRQRVAIARALASRPDVIVADEITSALDVSVQGAVLNLVRELQRELGLSMLFISHNLAVVRYVASSVAVMRDGRIVEHGDTAQILESPEHPYTRELLAAVPEPLRSAS
ncbi:ABC transporter ATP-binding protein [Microbacterium album]|uniref:Dipeptide/oligopeptide/nickel ABC transporter ATP-binding protein n=1 Tax=Microbacterium album TaxID=2053191 RepID=A0A917IFZ6_9MICO|nr:ATP-binding cassette domain-containing protein [Microbacterium album]GGH45213.1 dipeptide/oligopeptide/nickel ABC transporter ATP-binding protein [Microbacterium album]